MMQELDNLGTETIDNQTNMLQAASNGSNIGVQIRMPSGVNLMEEVNPNELPFGGHYGIHANHPDHIGNHSGLQTSNTLQFGQQNLGNQAGVQWIYQNIFQSSGLKCYKPCRKISQLLGVDLCEKYGRLTAVQPSVLHLVQWETKVKPTVSPKKSCISQLCGALLLWLSRKPCTRTELRAWRCCHPSS
ncbi:hypothetical protein HPP92_001595 [Vanilla planifolia]|uniref:Uncharacterized protein n=1 Tax=Vanilla planifolia TaxID=51239 RepID=A0A835S2T8_VANPL|nr:hypothetical protein HPP92_001595 [Vanilla planifolia]